MTLLISNGLVLGPDFEAGPADILIEGDRIAAVRRAPAPDEATLEAVVQAYREVGLRVIVAPAVTDRAFYEIVPGLPEALPDELGAALAKQRPAEAERLLALTEAALKRWHGSEGGRI